MGIGIIMLPVTGAFHCALMFEAQNQNQMIVGIDLINFRIYAFDCFK
jgi:hypothetical protein